MNRRSTVAATAALLLAALLERPQDSKGRVRREATSRALAEVVEEGRAARSRGRDVQLRFTWVGPQSEVVPTVVLGTRGHRLDMAKYEGLRVAGLHYGNDAPDLVNFVQLGDAAWRALFDALDAASARELFDTPVAEGGGHVRHVTLTISDRARRTTRYAQALTGRSDTFVASICALLERPELDAIDAARLLRAH